MPSTPTRAINPARAGVRSAKRHLRATMRMSHLKGFRALVHAVNLFVGPGLAFWIWTEEGLQRVILFLVAWFFLQAAFGSITNLIERRTLSAWLSAGGDVSASDQEDSLLSTDAEMPSSVAASMFIWLVGTLLLPWIIAALLLGWF